MVRNLLHTFILLLVANLAISQIDIDPQSIEFVGEGQESITEYIEITNNTGDVLNLYWEFVPAEGYPAEWTTQICDINLCYAPNKLKSSAAMPNTIENETTVEFSFKVWNNNGNVEGTSYGILNLYDDSDFTNLVASTSAPLTSTNNFDVQELVIYPNPTTEFIQIKNDASISSISIFNVVGRLVNTLDHSTGMVHDLTGLRSGMYLVRLEDKNGDVIKSMRLSKK
ncbi:MAG: T9SS type A sorting domain-containing protein [Saprospiraceae bacterium]|nr:T9SS type A sorting domain-containing protein [Saprospiraceae bacterium]